MKWIIAFCLVIIALGVFVEPERKKISDDDIVPIVADRVNIDYGTTGTYTIINGPTPVGTNSIGRISISADGNSASSATWTSTNTVQCVSGCSNGK